MVVEGVQRVFFQTTAEAEAIRRVYQACFEIQLSKGQNISDKQPDERELEVVQEAQTWHPIPLREKIL